MDIAEHKKEFDRIVKQYSLHTEEKSGEIADFLTKNKDRSHVSAEEFSKLFAMSEKDAGIFLSFIDKGLRFKEKHIKR